MTYTIRPMVKADLDQVTEIDHEAFPSQWPPANYRQELQNKSAHYLVACDDAKTFNAPEVKAMKPGFGLFSRLMNWTRRRQDTTTPPVPRQYIVGFSGIWLMADEAHLTNIAVRYQYKGKGLGELLLIATIDLAVSLKASFMTLEVRASNLVAQNLYGKYGFTQMGIRHGYYLDNREDAIIMSTESITADSFQAHIRQLREALSERLS